MTKTKSSYTFLGILITGLVAIAAAIASYILLLRPRHLR